MKVAILTQYYPPETGAPQGRLSDLARRLVARGHSVQVLTGLPNYPGTRVFEGYEGRSGTTEWIDGVRVARTWLYVPSRPTFYRRLANYGSFAAAAALSGGRLLSPCDVLIVESPPLFLVPTAWWLARRLGARLVVNVSDLWPRSAVALGMVGPGPALSAAERLEAWSYRRADLVLGQTEGIVQDIRGRFDGVDVRIFPNGVDLDAYAEDPDGTRRRDGRARLGWPPELFVVAYTGVLGHAQGLDAVLDAASRLDPESHLHIALFGEGPLREHLTGRIQAEGITAARVYGPVSRSRVIQVQVAADAGLVPLRDDPLFSGARPSKMFEFMAAARPIVFAGRGEGAGIVEAGASGPVGVVVPPEDPDALVRALAGLRDDRAGAHAMGVRGRRLAVERFDRAQLAVDLEADLLHLLNPEGTT